MPAVPETTHRHPVREALGQGLAVLAVCVGAKALLAVERYGAAGLLPDVRLATFLRADVLAALAFVALSLAVLLPNVGAYRARVVTTRVLVGLVGLYAGINIVFFRLFSTPINRTLLEVARGGVHDLSSSILGTVTVANALPLSLCVGAAVLLPWALSRVAWRRLPSRAALAAVVLACTLVVASAQGANRAVEARGLDRNPLWQAAAMLIPEPAGSPSSIEAPLPAPAHSLVEPGAQNLDLSHLRGAAADMNVLLVVMESTSAQYLGAYGADPDPMPNVTALADNALVFDAWYAPTPSSMKVLFSLLCATWPYPTATAETYVAPRLPCHSLPKVMSEGGLRTQHITSARFSHSDKTAFLDDRGYEAIWDAQSLPKEEGTYVDSWGVAEEASTAQILRFVDSIGPDERFFVSYVPIFPHHPYVVPTGEEATFGDATPFDRYRSAMAYSDRNLGHLIQALEARGLLDDTIIVLVGDHGEAFAQHPGNRIHSIAIYEENVHVPAIVSNRRLFEGQTRVPGPADHTALAPTVLDLLGVEAPERWQGRSMLDGERSMARFFTDYSFLYLGLRDGRFKYIHDSRAKTDELYDVEADPKERRNLAPRHAELVQEYRANALQWHRFQSMVFNDYDAFVLGQVSSERGLPIETLVPVEAEQGWGRLRVRRSVGNRPLTVGGRVYDTGLGTHAPGHIRYDLEGNYARLDGLVGRDDEAMDGLIEAEIWVDGALAFTSGPLRKGQSTPFSISLDGAQSLELRSLDGGDSTRGDHVDWMNTRLH
jgi:arylsulfatase A-like enzyme